MKGPVYIDAHHHLWDLGKNDYEWLTPELAPIYRDFTANDFRSASANTSVQRAILVQADPSFRETVDLLITANQHDYIDGVIGWVDFDQPEIAIDQLQQLKTYPKFLGVRPMIQDIPDPQWMLNRAFYPVFRYLVEEDLCFEALVRPEQLVELHQLLQRYPALRVVVDHAAKPDIASDDFDQWSQKIYAIAHDTQAYCKLSGLLTEALPGQQNQSSVGKYIKRVVELFGPQRVIWGSDWPVLLMASDYETWWAITQTALKDLPISEQQAILGGNAHQFYQLDRVALA